jgi:protein-tyrosine phosphatase
VLLVCTGNVCRSAVAERLGRTYLAELLTDDAGAIRLVSAGTRGVVGSAMHPDSARVLEGLGAHPGDFRARRLTERLVADADLTLTMTRRHRADALALAPRALTRTFTLREAAALLELVEEGRDVQADSFADRARALIRQMAGARARRPGSEDDDVRDPIGRPVEVHQMVGEAIAEALHPVLRRFAALVPPGAGRDGTTGGA